MTMKIRRLFFVGLWILSLVTITNFGGAVSYGFFFGMTMIPVISLIYIACVYFNFKIYQEIGSRSMVCGQPETYFFVLQNEDHFAFTSVSVRLFSDFSDVEELPGDTEYELLPGDRFTFETRIMCKYRGEYEVGVKEVMVTDFLRLFRVRYANPGTIKALVNPKVVRLSELKSVEDFQALLRKEAFTGTEPDVDIRNYVEGDPMNRIHWKTTARERTLKTRTRSGEEKQGISIFCDMTRYDRDRKVYLPLENKMLETLLALGFFFAGKEIPFSVYYGQNGLVREQVKGIRDFDAFYQTIAGVTFQEKEEMYDTLEEAVSGGGLWACQAAFFILHKLDDRIMEMTERLNEAGTVTMLYVIANGNQEVYLRQSSERRRMIVIPIEAGLEGVL
nr:DUF58 domain-containing protein [uncultured Acetatifactor sp.]